MSAARYDRVAMTLHWLIAALILLDFGLALSFSHADPGSRLYFSFAYDQHMSVGMMVLVLSVLRLGWRLLHRPPPLPPPMAASLRLLARVSHAALYVFMLGAPLSGWVILSVRKRSPPLAGDLSWPNLQFLTDLDHPHRALIHDAFLPGHIWFSYAGMMLVVLHVMAALYHHYLSHDDVMRRMLPWVRLRPGPESVP